MMFIRAFLLLNLAILSLFAAIGKVTAVSGEAKLTRAQQEIPVTIGMDLEEKDQINTQKQTKVQLIFNDGTTITVGSGSQFSIDEYLFDEANNQAGSKFNFGDGLFRTITGKIGKVAPDKFKMATKTATIGIRGSTSTMANTGDQTQLFVEDGGYTVQSVNPDVPPVDVDAGQKITATPGGVTPPEPYTPQDLAAAEQQNEERAVEQDQQQAEDDQQQQDEGEGDGEGDQQQDEGEGDQQQDEGQQDGEGDGQAQDDEGGQQQDGEGDQQQDEGAQQQDGEGDQQQQDGDTQGQEGDGQPQQDDQGAEQPQQDGPQDGAPQQDDQPGGQVTATQESAPDADVDAPDVDAPDVDAPDVDAPDVDDLGPIDFGPVDVNPVDFGQGYIPPLNFEPPTLDDLIPTDILPEPDQPDDEYDPNNPDYDLDAVAAATDSAPVVNSVTITPSYDSYSSIGVVFTESELLANTSDTGTTGVSISTISVASSDGVIIDNGDGTYTFMSSAGPTGYTNSVTVSFTVTDGTHSVEGTATLNPPTALDSSAATVPADVSSYVTSWGYWVENGFAVTDIAHVKDVWLSGSVTPPTYLQNYINSLTSGATSNWNYSGGTAIGRIYNGTAYEAISSSSVNLDFALSNSGIALSGGSMNLTGSGGVNTVNISNLTGAATVNGFQVTGFTSGGTISVDPSVSSMGGLFYGDQAQAVGGKFDLKNTAGTAGSQGAFSAPRTSP